MVKKMKGAQNEKEEITHGYKVAGFESKDL